MGLTWGRRNGRFSGARRQVALVAATLVAAVLSLSAQPSPNDRYVSPTGRSAGAGTLEDPWDLATALSGTRVSPGQTIWLRGGAYKGPVDSRLTGRANAAITVRSYPGERAVLVDSRQGASGGTLNVRGAWTIYRDFNITNVSPDRRYRPTRRPMAIEAQAPNTKFINLVIHDAGNGIGFWKEAVDAEIYGCIIFNGGQYDPDAGGRGHGHGIYTQNNEGTKLLADNIIFNNFGWGIHAYPNPGELKGYLMEGNALFNNGRWAGNSIRYNNLIVNAYKPYKAERITIRDNYLYHSQSQRPTDKFGDAALCLGCADPAVGEGLVLQGNYIVNGIPGLLSGVWKNMAVTGNTFAGSPYMTGFVFDALSKINGVSWNNNRYYLPDSASSTQPAFGLSNGKVNFDEWKRATGYDTQSELVRGMPSEAEAFVRPNRYEAGRAHIIVFNWAREDYVNVDVSSVLKSGDHYELRNAEDYLGDSVSSGTYSGGPLRLPMKDLKVAIPLGYRAADTSSDPQFRVFVLSQTPISAAPAPAVTQLPARSRTARRVASAGPTVDKFVGLYRAADGRGDLRIERTGNVLYAVAISEPGAPRYVMVPLTEGLYRLEGGPEGALLEFTLEGSRVTQLRLTQGEISITLAPAG